MKSVFSFCSDGGSDRHLKSVQRYVMHLGLHTNSVLNIKSIKSMATVRRFQVVSNKFIGYKLCML
jgi:hypothetical protein